MTKRTFSIFVIYLLLFSAISIQINADAPSADNQYPLDDKPEVQEKWILEHPSSFNPDNPNQKDAFIRAYNKGQIKYPDHIEATSKYVSTLNNGFANDKDRQIAAKYVSYLMNQKGADFKQGDIKITVEGNYRLTYIITSDGVRWDLNQLSKDEKLKAIKSRQDGTLELIYNEGTVNARGTSLTKNQNNEFVTSSGQTFSVESLNGKTATVSASGSSLNIKCDNGCVLSKGYMVTTLNPNGAFWDFGNNRFQVEDGATRLGQNVLAGKYSFSLNIDKDGHTTLDTSKKIELFKFGKIDNLRNSFIHLEDPQVNDGKLHFGTVDVATSRVDPTTGLGAGKVVACFDCKDFDKSRQGGINGYVDFKSYQNSNCDSATCETVYKAEMKGLVAARFEKDAFHEGFDRNLVASYYPNGKDASKTDMGIFTLESCKGCKVGAGQIVGIQTLNNNFFQIQNNYYSDAKQEPQLRYKQITTAPQVIPYLQYAKFNQEGITFFDKDIYKEGRLSDTLNTGMYKSDVLTGRDNAGKNVKKYIEDFYTKEYKGNIRDAVDRTNSVLRDNLNPQYSRNLYVIDNTAFNYDKNGNKINVQNLYVTTKNNEVIIDQLRAVESGIYSNFFQRESTKEILDILDRKGITDPQKRQEEFERLNALKSDEIFFKTRLQFLSAIIDGGRAIHEDHPAVSEFIRKHILNTFPRDEAELFLGNYKVKYAGSKKIFEWRSEGKSLEEIYKNSGSSPQIKAAFQEPYLVHALNSEMIYKAKLYNEPTLSIYYLENGEIKTKNIDASLASRTSALDASRAYIKDSNSYFSDTRLAFDIYTGQITNELILDKDKETFQKYVKNILGTGKLHPNSRYYEGTIYFSNAGLSEKNYIRIGEGKYFVASNEIIQMAKNGKLDVNQLIELSQINQKYQQDAKAQQLKLFAEAFIPKSMAELAINIVPEAGSLAKGAQAVYKAGSVLRATAAFGELSGNIAFAGLVGISVTPRTQLKKALLERPEVVRVSLLPGAEIKLVQDANQELKLLNDAKRLAGGSEFPADVVVHQVGITTKEGTYISPKVGEDIVVFGDAPKDIIYDFMAIKQSHGKIRETIDIVDLQKSFPEISERFKGMSWSFADLSIEEQQGVIEAISKASAFKGNIERSLGGDGRIIWIAQPQEGDADRLANAVGLGKKARDSLIQSQSLTKVDLRKNLGMETKFEDLTRPQIDEVIDRIARFNIHSQEGTVVSYEGARELRTGYDVHTHPISFELGSQAVRDELKKQIDKGYRIRWDAETSARIKTKVAPELQKDVRQYEGFIESHRDELSQLKEDAGLYYMSDVKYRFLNLQFKNDAKGMQELTESIRNDGFDLPRFDGQTGKPLTPEVQLKLFTERPVEVRIYQDAFDALVKRKAGEIQADIDFWTIERDSSQRLLDLIEGGAPDIKLYYSSLDVGTILPSFGPVGDINTLVNLQKEWLTHPSGIRYRVGRNVYLFGGTTYIYVEGSDKVIIVPVIGKNSLQIDIPLSTATKGLFNENKELDLEHLYPYWSKLKNWIATIE
ncbi:hypothetical protein HYY70_03280 [Candidatus Woesearchaeota archaeon]|nr:hypothetical protein [Candidatus Woesearchaeota archaeon]